MKSACPVGALALFGLFGLLAAVPAQAQDTLAIIINFDRSSPMQGTAALRLDEPVGVLIGNDVSGLQVEPAVIRGLMDSGDAMVTNDGRLRLTPHAQATLQGSVIRNTGVIPANELVVRNGQLYLDQTTTGSGSSLMPKRP